MRANTGSDGRFCRGFLARSKALELCHIKYPMIIYHRLLGLRRSQVKRSAWALLPAVYICSPTRHLNGPFLRPSCLSFENNKQVNSADIEMMVDNHWQFTLPHTKTLGSSRETFLQYSPARYRNCYTSTRHERPYFIKNNISTRGT